MTLPTPLRYARTAAVGSVALWLVYGLFTAPEVVSSVLLLAALPLLLVALPALFVWAADSEPVTFELRVGLPTREPDEHEGDRVTDGVPVTDGGRDRP